LSYSLHLRGGDLSPAGRSGAAVVSGTQKLVQDLRNALLEPRGTDPANPSYGSTLDGGLNPDGTVSGTNIGENITRERMAGIETEVRRILTTHQNEQVERIQREALRYGGKHTLTPGEMLHAVEAIDTMAIQDTVLVRARLRTRAGRSVNITQAAS
jgi:hypothetical protein